jgi:hypothetical protein
LGVVYRALLEVDLVIVLQEMNKEIINATQLYLNEPKLAADFLVRNLGFVIHRYAISKILDSVKVYDSYGNIYELPLNAHTNEKNTSNIKLIINTADCLQDFHLMERKGICILTKPHYVPEGLAFEISDYWNNRYIILEERDYSDQ